MQQLLLIFWRPDSAPNITLSSGLNARILPNSKAATNVYTETLNAKRWRSPLLHQLHYKCIRVYKGLSILQEVKLKASKCIAKKYEVKIHIQQNKKNIK